jgi:small subunit ribosomal protein S16
MALKIRLRRMGRKKAPHYRIVVAESSMPRDGRFVTTIGHYNPRTEPMTLVVERDKARQWLKNGAKPTETVQRLFTKAGVYSAEPVVAAEEAAQGAAGAVASAAKKTAAAAATVVETVRESVAEAVDAVQERVGDAVEAVQERVGDVVEAVQERVSGGGDEPVAESDADATAQAGAEEAGEQAGEPRA